MPVIPYREHNPKIGEDVFIAPDAWVTGDVTIEDRVSIFFGASLRGDILPIRVGVGTNIQEHAILHTSTDLHPCLVGNYVTVGHHAIVHGCTVGDNALIGMGAIILDGAVIGEECVIGAQTLVTMNAEIPARSLVLGVPGKVMREVTDEDLRLSRENTMHYIQVGTEYRAYFEEQARAAKISS